MALVEACAFDTGAFPAGAGVDCAGENDVLNQNRAANAASAGRWIDGVTRGGEDKHRIFPLYAELDASERVGESLA
jgi:hypothetical protein